MNRKIDRMKIIDASGNEMYSLSFVAWPPSDPKHHE